MTRRQWVWFGTLCFFSAALVFFGFWRAFSRTNGSWVHAAINFGFAIYFGLRAADVWRELRRCQAWYAEVEEFSRQHRWIESPIGRRRRFPEN